MQCQAPGCKDPDQDLLYNVPGRQFDGALSATTCRDCGVRLGIICETHNFPHLGFDDDTTACIKCVQEIIEECTISQIQNTWRTLQEKIPKSAWNDLHEDNYFAVSDPLMLLHCIATRAMRNKTTIDVIVKQIIAAQNFRLLMTTLPLCLIQN